MAGLVYTIYNCGTAFNSAKDDAVAKLNRMTLSDHDINDGAGSGTFKPDLFGGRDNPGGTNKKHEIAAIGIGAVVAGPLGAAAAPFVVKGLEKLGGMLFGVGVEHNVRDAVAAIAGKQPDVVNMCGWSRGAVTCSKIAFQMHQIPALRDIPVNIFNIDPVPGTSPLGNKQNWKNITLTPNVRRMVALFAQHERKWIFTPARPTPNGVTQLEIDTFPGVHGSMVLPTEGMSDVSTLVLDYAKRFLTECGTQFLSPLLLSRNAQLFHYARVQADFHKYRDVGRKDGRFMPFSPVTRVIKDDRGKKVGKFSPDRGGFFINNHHERIFRTAYPHLTRELTAPPDKAFSNETRSYWVNELAIMTKADPVAAEQVTAYLGNFRK